MRRSNFFFEDEVMTMQIAMEARDGFVLASDLKTMTTGNPGLVTRGTAANYPIYESKIVVNQKHKIAIARAGYQAHDAPNDAKELSDGLENIDKVPEEFGPWLEEWGNGYLKRNEVAGSSLLVVHPTAKESINRIRTLVLWERPACKVETRHSWTLHANQLTPATFWPQLFKADQKPRLPRAINIAAWSILMAGALHNSGVGKLELYRFIEKWEPLSEAEIDRIESKFLLIMDTIEEAVNG